MKRRTWRRWPAKDAASVEHRGRGRGKGKPVVCPVCGTPLVTGEQIEEGPHGPERVRLTRCPNPDCPRARELRNSGSSQ